MRPVDQSRLTHQQPRPFKFKVTERGFAVLVATSANRCAVKIYSISVLLGVDAGFNDPFKQSKA